MFNLSNLCHQVIKETSFIDNEHTIEAKISSDVMLIGDLSLIKELLRILMNNALKYTPEGGKIILCCTMAKHNIILSIKDTGLGLAIAKQIITVHHAQISVTSESNKGTEFIIFFEK